MDFNTDIAEVATPVLKLWAQFDRDEPGPGLAPRETYYRQSAFIAGMAGACTSLLTGAATFVHDSESLAVARCPLLWDDYRAEACQGEPPLLQVLQEKAFLAGMASVFAVVANGAGPEALAPAIMAAALVTARAEAARHAEEN